MACPGESVVGVNLYGEVGFGVDELDEEGKCRAVTLVDVSAYEVGSVCVDELGERLSGERAAVNDRYVAWDG